MNTLQSPRGTRDILPSDQPYWDFIYKAARTIAKNTGFKQIQTPTYEEMALFTRSIGTGTDVIDKELFSVKGVRAEEENQYALRPEGTAGIVRAYIEHGMRTLPQPVKLFSFVNCFRYDRPQKGRYREHIQFDLECFGQKGAFADAWVIYTTYTFLKTIGLPDAVASVNSLGTSEERQTYIEALKSYLLPHREELSPDSKMRLETNPLRILDSKHPGDQALCNEGPHLIDFLGEESKAHYAQVTQYLSLWKVPFTQTHSLVRGLDYYSHTAFEWVLTGKTGQQHSLGGGGRYDTLLTQLGGQDMGAVGAGLGLDRIVEELIERGLPLPNTPSKPSVYCVVSSPDLVEPSLEAISLLLSKDIKVEANLDTFSVANQLKAASKCGSDFALIFAEEEWNQGKVILKNLESGNQTEEKLVEVVARLTL